jgi:choline dehydrogenase
MRPTSRGTVRAASPDPFALPAIEPNYLDTVEDCRVLVGGVRAVRRILASEPIASIITGENEPGPQAIADSEILAWCRETGVSSYHFSSSCRMAPSSDASAVVDDQLRVHGLEGLRIADASVLPNISTNNTNAPTMMIAEKAADLILGRPAPPSIVVPRRGVAGVPAAA